MKERTERLKAILDIIQSAHIDSQEEIRKRLNARGISVTQATLSRDLKYLNIGKTSNGVSGYFYALPTEKTLQETEQSYIRDFQRGFISIDHSGNLSVIKTFPGHANSVGSALDNLQFPEILGTIAGDDTVLVIPREGMTAENLIHALNTRIFSKEEE